MAKPHINFTLVQALRGLAALWVVLFHAAEGGHIERLRLVMPKHLFAILFDAGHYGVAIFFALSGFVIAHSLRDAVVTPLFAGKFILRRSIRLDPTYWATIALILAQQFLKGGLTGGTGTLVSVGQIAAHLFYATDVLGYRQINVVFWTLCFEIQFYLGFILLLVLERSLSLRFGKQIGAIVRSTMFVLAAAGALHLYHDLHVGIALIMWHSFFVGITAYWAAVHGLRWLVALIALAGVMAVYGSTGDLISAATALLLYIAMQTGRITTALSSAPLQWLGMISYSLYLTHNFVAGSAFWALGKVVHGGSGLSDAFGLIVVTGVCLVAAFVMWWLVERPSHNLAKYIGRARRPSS